MPSFDVVSEIDLQEIDNALNSVVREMQTRYDFKGAKASIEHDKEKITLLADDDTKLKAMQDLIMIYTTRRKLDNKSFEFVDPEKAGGGMIRQIVKIRQGISSELAKKIVKAIKDQKFKVQASIKGEEVRIDGKKRDDLQEVIAFLKKFDIDLPLQFTNFRD